jgi:hypothetical protein
MAGIIEYKNNFGEIITYYPVAGIVAEKILRGELKIGDHIPTIPFPNPLPANKEINSLQIRDTGKLSRAISKNYPTRGYSYSSIVPITWGEEGKSATEYTIVVGFLKQDTYRVKGINWAALEG